MINIEKILKQDRQIRATTGLNQQRFEMLLPIFAEAYQETLDKKRRWRATGGGRKATLKTSADKLFFILLYCKCYPTFDLMSVLFGFDRSCAHDWVHRLMPILETALGNKQALPERKIDSIEEFMAKFAEVQEVIIDGTERPVQRPKDAERQKEHYSGKKTIYPQAHDRKHPQKTDNFVKQSPRGESA
ncbi:MAG: transposase family protein [Pseudanabaena sp. Salubria-1]|nr:transposase family protein [Pseudanabaena sp. Salubria-1]